VHSRFEYARAYSFADLNFCNIGRSSHTDHPSLHTLVWLGSIALFIFRTFQHVDLLIEGGGSRGSY